MNNTITPASRPETPLAFAPRFTWLCLLLVDGALARMINPIFGRVVRLYAPASSPISGSIFTN